MENNIEKKEEIKKDKSKLYAWLAACSVCIIFGLFFWFDYKKDVEMQEKYVKTETALKKELLLNLSCNHHVDSLVYINGELSKYQSLTMAMVHRDDATKELKYGVGDIVYLKSDSSRVVIEDLLIGGGKYNYFIKYKVLFKDDSRKEVTPEMVY